MRAEPFDRLVVAYAEVVDDGERDAKGGEEEKEFPMKTFDVGEEFFFHAGNLQIFGSKGKNAGRSPALFENSF